MSSVWKCPGRGGECFSGSRADREILLWSKIGGRQAKQRLSLSAVGRTPKYHNPLNYI